MATITTTEYLDSGTARTAGEAMSINGGTLIIRTDTRWHAGAPSAMTGTIGQFTFSGGGNVEFDGTKVRWVAYTSAVGTVPSWGSTISQGSVSGYILGFYSSLTAAPTAIGSAIPSSGFLKLREVTGGAFSAGASTGGVSLTFSGPDVPGWIEIVMDAAGSLANVGLNAKYKSRGDWFYLDNTNGSRGQIIQVPTNGGGAGTNVPLVQIETSPGSGVYEWWSTMTVANGFTNTNLATTDNRARVLFYATGGQIQVGSDGTNNVAALPPSGCKVRIPNIFLRFAATASRASNANSGTKPSMTYSGGGIVDFQNVSCEWNIFGNASSATEVDFVDSSLDTISAISALTAPSVWNNVGIGGGALVLSTTAMALSSISTPLSMNNTSIFVAPSASNVFALTSVNNASFDGLETVVTRTRTSTTAYGVSTATCVNLSFTNLKLKGASLNINASVKVSVSNVDYIDRLGGDTNSTQALYALRVQNSADVVIDGITFGNGNTINAVHPYNGLVQVNANLGSVKIRNAGTVSAPLNCGTTAASYPASVIAASGIEPALKAQRLYLANVRTGFVSGVTTVRDSLIEHVYGGQSISTEAPGQNTVYRAIGGTASTTNATGRAGRHWSDYFTSNTTGQVLLSLNAPTNTTSGQVTLYATSTATGFYGDGRVMLANVGDYIIVEMPTFVIGHTGFQNAAIGGNVSTNCKTEYQIDTGSGWNGTWKTVNGTNLSAETISPSTGFKLKIKVTCNTAGTNNSCYNVLLATTSSLSAQASNLYVLETVTLGFTNLVPGSEVRVYQGSDPATAVEIGGTESVGGTTFSFTHSAGGQYGVIAIFALGYQPIYLPYTFKTTDDSILIQQVIDRNYVNPV